MGEERKSHPFYKFYPVVNVRLGIDKLFSVVFDIILVTKLWGLFC